MHTEFAHSNSFTGLLLELFSTENRGALPLVQVPFVRRSPVPFRIWFVFQAYDANQKLNFINIHTHVQTVLAGGLRWWWRCSNSDKHCGRLGSTTLPTSKHSSHVMVPVDRLPVVGRKV